MRYPFNWPPRPTTLAPWCSPSEKPPLKGRDGNPGWGHGGSAYKGQGTHLSQKGGGVQNGKNSCFSLIPM